LARSVAHGAAAAFSNDEACAIRAPPHFDNSWYQHMSLNAAADVRIIND
jgi:hypothetical protein